MAIQIIIRRALNTDALSVDRLLSAWFDWKPENGRLGTIKRAVRNGELLVAQDENSLIGFIHYVIHEDIIDGGPNAFISAFYVSPAQRRKGIGTLLLKKAIVDSLNRGVVGVETSTTQLMAKILYERLHFKQTIGDIGEVFLELDISEFLRTRSRTDVK